MTKTLLIVTGTEVTVLSVVQSRAACVRTIDDVDEATPTAHSAFRLSPTAFVYTSRIQNHGSQVATA